MAVRLNLSPEIERVLEEKAARSGQTLEAYLEELVEREARAPDGVTGHAGQDPSEFERGLDELAEGLPPLPTLPADFSRADVYGEHA